MFILSKKMALGKMTFALILASGSAFAPSSWARPQSALFSSKPPSTSKYGAGKRDKDGFLITEELKYDLSGKDVSFDLGASLDRTKAKMPENVKEFIAKAQSSPESITFDETIKFIDENCDYIPKKFSVGDLTSESKQNEGSCKIFSFARMVGLDRDSSDKGVAGKQIYAPIETTLHLFGDYYRKDVLGNPSGSDHANIRGAIKEGWAGIRFPNGIALNLKSLAFGTEADVAELLDEAEVIEGGDAWDPDSDCWIP